MIELRNGQTTDDPRLDRLVEFDERSREHPIGAVVPEGKIASRTWSLRRDFMGDQGKEGACVEFGITHELAALPIMVQRRVVQRLRAEHAIYWPAQGQKQPFLPADWTGDPWEGGSYPGAAPRYEGTSLLSGVKVAQALGFFEAYRWAFGIDEAIAGLVHEGPAVIALGWTEGMSRPRPDGLIARTGKVVGGHCVGWIGVEFGKRFQDARRDVAVIAQSWGLGHGDRGRVYLPLDDLEAGLKDRGEVVFFTGRRRTS